MIYVGGARCHLPVYHPTIRHMDKARAGWLFQPGKHKRRKTGGKGGGGRCGKKIKIPNWAATDPTDECVTSVFTADSLIFRCVVGSSQAGKPGASAFRQRWSLSSAAPAAAAAAAAAQPSSPPTLDGNSLVGSFYGLRARSAAVDQSRSLRQTHASSWKTEHRRCSFISTL